MAFERHVCCLAAIWVLQFVPVLCQPNINSVEVVTRDPMTVLKIGGTGFTHPGGPGHGQSILLKDPNPPEFSCSYREMMMINGQMQNSDSTAIYCHDTSNADAGTTWNTMVSQNNGYAPFV